MGRLAELGIALGIGLGIGWMAGMVTLALMWFQVDEPSIFYPLKEPWSARKPQS